MRLAKTPKDYSAMIDDLDPIIKATQSVNDVIVMDGPACFMALLIRSLAGS